MKSVVPLATALLCTLCLLTAPAPAAVMTLGNSGWTASWDSELYPDLSLRVDHMDQQVVVIEKAARFLNPPANGQFEIIPITFTQTSADAVPFIVINDEVIENLTGEDWSGFIFSLTGEVQFDIARTNLGGPGGFHIGPFTHFEYSNDNKTLTVSEGAVSHVAPVTNLWRPGMAGGALWIAANPAGPEQQFRSFILTEQPVPEPASLATLALATLTLLRPRRT